MLALMRNLLFGCVVAVSIALAGRAAAFWDPITDACQPPAISGTGRAIDGNTLVLTGQGEGQIVIRLHAIDAPDPAQTCRAGGEIWLCGRDATRTLADLVDGRELACLPCGYDQAGRTLALCRDGEADIGVGMVRAGMAMSRAFFSNALHASEVWAQRQNLGLWRGDFVDPIAWRQGRRLGPGPCRGCVDP
jgi:endonuclease YncB( thermonuclease family)